MKAERFGSYSTDLMMAGISRLLYKKSTSRKRRLCPPPLWRIVIRPALFLPTLRRKPCVRDFVGSDFVKTSRYLMFVICRRDLVVGLYVFIPLVIGNL